MDTNMTRNLDTDVQRYLTTLRRIPKEVRLSMATREYDMNDPATCVCGWAIRDELLRAVGSENESHGFVQNECAERFGGEVESWDAIFDGVCYPERLPLIEEAFTLAVMEAVGASRTHDAA